MAETSWNRTGPDGIQQARINVPAPDPAAAMQVDRADPRSYSPLHVLAPGELPHAPVLPPPPPKTEEELRFALRAALAAQVDAAAVVREAADAHARALHNVHRCQSAAAKYVGIDTEVDDFTLTALRDHGRADLPDTLRAKLGQREVAQVELASAERVAATLLRELAQATQQQQAAAGAVTRATMTLTVIARGRLRDQLDVVEKRVAAFAQVIEALDGSTIWQPFVDRLHADPLDASLDMEVGDEPILSPAQLAYLRRDPGEVTVLNPDGTSETMTHEEYAARDRARAVAEAAAVHPEIAEEHARRLANRMTV